MKIKDSTNKIIIVILILLVSILGLLPMSSEAKAKSNNKFNYENSCTLNINKRWAWTLDGAWLSTNKTGDWEKDNWFYKIKSGEPVVVTQEDSMNGYYLVCFDFGSEQGYDSLVGWIQKEKILLQSQITPVSP